MRKGWQTVKLGDVCALDKAKYREKNLPFIGLEDIESGSGRFIGSRDPQHAGSATFRFTDKHVLYGRLRPYLNKVLLPDFEGHCSSEIFPIVPSDRLDKKFLYYWITSDPIVDAINRTCTGARMPRANVNEVLTFDFPLPPLPEQKRIVAILDEAFEGIRRAVANAEKNLANARELFDSYLNAVFTQKGEGWKVVPLKELCENFKDDIVDGPFGANLKREHYKSEGIPVLKIQNIKPFEISLKNMDYVDEAKAKELKRHAYEKGDIIITKLGLPLGISAIVEDIADGIIVADLVRVRAGKVDTKYLCYHLNSPVTNAFLNAQQGGATRPRVRISAVRELPIHLPPLPEQKCIVAKLNRLSAETVRLGIIYQQKLTALTELKQSLLQKAFTGELTADTVEKVIDEVVA